MSASVVTVCVVCMNLLAYIVGRWHERQVQHDRRGGMLHPPASAGERVENWCCPDRPYDQEAQERGDAMLLATVGHPLLSAPIPFSQSAGPLPVEEIRQELGPEAATMAAGLNAARGVQP